MGTNWHAKMVGWRLFSFQMAFAQNCLFFILFYMEKKGGGGAIVKGARTEKLIVGRWYQTGTSSSCLGHAFFYKHTKCTNNGLEKCLSLVWDIWATVSDDCIPNKLHGPKGYCLNMFWTTVMGRPFLENYSWSQKTSTMGTSMQESLVGSRWERLCHVCGVICWTWTSGN